MTPDQYRHYNRTGEVLPKEAQAQGFHYCAEWDEMLVGAPMTQEWSVCTCKAKQDYHDKVQAVARRMKVKYSVALDLLAKS